MTRLNGDLGRLIGACVDDEDALSRASIEVDPVRRRGLERLAREREAFVVELQAAGRTLKGHPPARASWKGALRTALHRAWVVAVGRNAGDALSMCRRSQDRTEASYAAALELDWSRELTQVITEQHGQICAARDVIMSLR
jgi:uncharacterized protein (TIGR02284 family)